MTRGDRQRPGLVATDLDGTLLRSDGTISPRTVAALAAVEEAGVPLVFVTGRPPRWMHEVAEATGHHGVAVCANGAVIYDVHTEQVVASYPLAVDAALTAVRLLRDALPGVGFAVEHEGGFGHEPSYHPQWYDGDDVRIAAVEELLDGPPTKLLLRIEGLGADAMLRTAREVLGDTVEVTHSNSRDGLVEVSASGVSKATTLAELCAERGLSAADVLAFGDMPNDLPLLAWAGTAYAVANAHPDVLAAVDRRTASNDDDGVARILEEFFGPGSGAAA